MHAIFILPDVIQHVSGYYVIEVLTRPSKQMHLDFNEMETDSQGNVLELIFIVQFF